MATVGENEDNKFSINQISPFLRQINFKGWSIAIHKSTILDSKEADNLKKDLELPICPEMLFGKNGLEFSLKNSNFKLNINPIDALKNWKAGDTTATSSETPNATSNRQPLKVAFSEEWASAREEIKNMPHQDYDWTFTNEYKGTIEGGSIETTTEEINITKLSRRDPILHFEELPLFEDELGDSGISHLSCKMRIVEGYFYCLLRFWLRVDGVIYRIHDTRLFHEFGTNNILTEFQIREQSFKNLQIEFSKQKDIDFIFQQITPKERHLQKIIF
eukprot:TRINITY_DN384_c0_g1_i1.p1 TRINITY_DN384_c0_g1~~TRINITY_DN384_c0_g1_i1.p1  ORF type:complete len:275 (+),score=114.47 TRINITY_DN384_c0_g1_i1:57-881(+)